MSDEAFVEALKRVMLEKKISKSELARRLYGTTTDARGHVVAKNFNQVTRILDPKIQKQIKTVHAVSDALEIPASDLMPALFGERAGSGLYVERIDDDNSRLEITMTVPHAVASSVLVLLAPYAK